MCLPVMDAAVHLLPSMLFVLSPIRVILAASEALVAQPLRANSMQAYSLRIQVTDAAPQFIQFLTSCLFCLFCAL
jgi:hypothetical protein